MSITIGSTKTMTRFFNVLFHSVFTILGSTASRMTDVTYNLQDDTNIETMRNLRVGGNGQGRRNGQGYGYGGGRQNGGGGGGGGGGGRGWQGGGQGNGNSHRDIIQKLFDHRDEITREFTKETNAVDASTVSVASTTSNNPEVAGWIKLHVKQMEERMGSGMMVRHWDELFEKMFDHRNELTLDWEEVDGGVKAVMFANNPDSPCPKALADAHTKVISAFIENGRAEAQKNHPAPNACD
jgi:hypothetical protein